MRLAGLAALRADWRLLAFGFLMAFASSAGQTYFISLFAHEFHAAFGLGHAGFGALYSAATLASGFLLIWGGGLLDRFDLRLFALAVLGGLTLAAAAAASAAGPLTLVVALFLLRFFGQGLASHTAVTSVARYADPAIRGKAVSLATLGFPADEALWPVAAMAPSFIVTGVLFHQVHLAETKGWSLAAFAAGYVGYAACQVGTALVAGPVVDRIGARRTARFYLAPLALGLVVLAAFDPIWSGYLFLMSAGATAGFSSTLLGTLWAELYGVRHLGAIRALVTACSVVASALSPVLLGALIDLGVTIEALALGCAAYAALGVAILTRLFGPGRLTAAPP